MTSRAVSAGLAAFLIGCGGAAASCVVPGLAEVAGPAGERLADRACNHALEVGRLGEDFRFQDPTTEVMGTITAGEAYQDRSGTLCRRLTVTVVSAEGTQARRRQWAGIACRRGEGKWVWSDVEIRDAGGEGSAMGGMREVQRRF